MRDEEVSGKGMGWGGGRENEGEGMRRGEREC